MSKRKLEDPEQPGAKRPRTDKELKELVQWKADFYDDEPTLTGDVDSLSQEEKERVQTWKPMKSKQPLPFLNEDPDASEYFRIISGKKNIEKYVYSFIEDGMQNGICMDEKRNPVKVYWYTDVDFSNFCGWHRKCEHKECANRHREAQKRTACRKTVMEDIEAGLTFCTGSGCCQFYVHKIGKDTYVATRHNNYKSS